MGRLTKDPDLRYTTTNNTAVCSFTIAVERKFNKPGEEKQADFIPIVAWNKTGEFCSKYFTKGKQIVVVGRMQTRAWDDNEGKKHYITEVVADEIFPCGSKKDSSNESAIPDTDENVDDLPF